MNFFNQEMKQELVDFKDVISSLQLLSKKVVPLPQRKSKLKSKLLVDPVCSYKNMQVSLILLSWCLCKIFAEISLRSRSLC